MRLVRDPVELLAREVPLLRDLLGRDPLHHDVVALPDERRHRAVVRAHRDARHHLDAARDDEVELSRPDRRGGVEVRLHRRAALAVDGRAATETGQPGGERDVAADVPRLLVDLRHAAPLHVLDLGGIDAVPLDERVHDLGRELVAADVRQRAVLLPDRAANGIDDDCARPLACPRRLYLASMLRKNAKIELIKRVPLFQRCSSRELAQSPRSRTSSTCRQAASLTSEGAGRFEFVVLVEGEADVVRKGTRRQQARPRRLPRRDRPRHGRPRTATVKTRAPARLLVLGAPGFRRSDARHARDRRTRSSRPSPRGYRTSTVAERMRYVRLAPRARDTSARRARARAACPACRPVPSSRNVWPTSPPRTTRPSGVSTSDGLVAAVSPGRRQEPDARQDLRLAVVLDVVRAVEVDPVADGVVVARTRVLELAGLYVDRHARERAGCRRSGRSAGA